MRMSLKAHKALDLILGLILNKGDRPQLEDTGKSFPSDFDPPKEYEICIQKLEADVRTHIRVEQQLKLHIETVHTKLEELERKVKTAENEKLEIHEKKGIEIKQLLGKTRK